MQDKESLNKLATHIQQKEVWREKQTTNFVNIATRYENLTEIDDSPKNFGFSLETSPKNFIDGISPKASKQKLLLSSIGNNQNETFSFEKSHKKISWKNVLNVNGQGPSESNSNQVGLKNIKPKKEEKLKILNFQQKSLIQKKADFDKSYAKLQKKLTRTLDEKEAEERELHLDYNLDEIYDECLNFTGKGLRPLNQSLSKINVLNFNIQSGESSPLNWNTSKSKEYVDEIKPEPFVNQTNAIGKRSLMHRDLKYRLIKKLGIDKLFTHNNLEESKSPHILSIDSKDTIKHNNNFKIFQTPRDSKIMLEKLQYEKGLDTKTQLKENKNSKLNFSTNDSFIKENNDENSPLKASRSIYQKILRFTGNGDD